MDLRLFSGRSNPEIAKGISRYLNLPLGDITITNFSDGETFVQINENVRGTDVFLIQSTCTPVNENLMELLIMIDAFKRSSVASITAVIPYFGYGRQDRKDRPRVPITAKLIADLLTKAGVERILTMDLHAPQIQGYFNIPVDNLYAAPVLISYFKERNLDKLVIFSPDAGGVERARRVASKLDVPLGIIDKRREKANVAAVMNIIGNVLNKRVLIIDDMIDTAGTLVESAKALLERGAEKVYAGASHAVFSGPALGRIKEGVLSKVVVTNTIQHNESRGVGNLMMFDDVITILPVCEVFGEAIKRIYENESISSLFR